MIQCAAEIGIREVPDRAASVLSKRRESERNLIRTSASGPGMPREARGRKDLQPLRLGTPGILQRTQPNHRWSLVRRRRTRLRRLSLDLFPRNHDGHSPMQCSVMDCRWRRIMAGLPVRRVLAKDVYWRRRRKVIRGPISPAPGAARASLDFPTHLIGHLLRQIPVHLCGPRNVE